MESSIFSILIIFGLLFTTLQIPDSSCLRNVKLVIPPFAKLGSTVHLRCEYDLEGEDLYAVKWYKGHQEFYRFVPKESPPDKLFQIPGLSLQIRNSSAHEIVLVEVSLDVSGTFKCVVSSEQFFQTMTGVGTITVVVIEDDRRRPPSLQLNHPNHDQKTPPGEEELSPGQNVTAQCTSPPSYPPSNLTWYLNGINLSHSASTGGRNLGYNARIYSGRHQHYTTPPQNSLPHHHQFLFQVTESLLTFSLPLTSSVVQLRCEATLFSEYNQSSTLSLVPIPSRFTPADPLLNSSLGFQRNQDVSLIILNFILIISSVVLHFYLNVH